MQTARTLLLRAQSARRAFSTIPYSPGLSLGNIVKQDTLSSLEEAGRLNSDLDVLQNSLNSDNMTLRSLRLTQSELNAMGVNVPDDMNKQVTELEDRIKQKALDLAKKRFEVRPQIDTIMGALPQVGQLVESPLDYNKSQIKTMPLSSNSLTLDSQYLSFDKNEQTADSFVADIKSYVAASTSFLGTEYSGKTSAAVQKQASEQMQTHEIQGTLIITANCTHEGAKIFAPLTLDVDKAINVWNSVYPEEKIKLPEGAFEIKDAENTENEKSLGVLSGVTTGSSFVGLVFVLKSEVTKTQQEMTSIASSLSAQMKRGAWFAKVSGGFGVDSTFAKDVKNMLSTQQILSHVALTTMGTIPSIAAGNVKIGVKELAEFDPAKMMDKLSALASNTNSSNRSLDEQADAAITGAQMVNFRNTEIQGVLSGLADIDDGQNKMLDVNTLMTAFEDFVAKASSGSSGVPVNYFIKPVTKSQLAKLWVDKYFPGEYMVAPQSNE